MLHASLLPLFFLFFPRVGLFPVKSLRSNPWGTQLLQHSYRWTCLKGILQVLTYPSLAQQSSLVPLEDSFSGCRGDSELCPLVLMPTLVRNASWIPVSWLRDCESFIFIHVPQFLIIFFLNAWDRARNMRDTAWFVGEGWRARLQEGKCLSACVYTGYVPWLHLRTVTSLTLWVRGFCVPTLQWFTSFGVKGFGKSVAVFVLESNTCSSVEHAG